MLIGRIIRKYRAMEELPLRSVSGEIGISAATLSRIERGEDCDSPTLARVFYWLFREEINAKESRNRSPENHAGTRRRSAGIA